MPFGNDCEFEDFSACVAANQDKDNPEGFCSTLMEATEESCANRGAAMSDDLLDEFDITLEDAEKYIRESDLEAIEAYRKGSGEAPTLYKAEGYVQKAGLNLKTAEGNSLIEFVASEESEDRMGDVIEVAGWDLEAFKSNPVFLFGHDHFTPAIGRVPRIGPEGKKLMAGTLFDQDDALAVKVERKFRTGFMRAVSVGFRPLEVEDIEGKAGKSYRFTKQELLELSAVNIPAHPRALMKALAAHRFIFTMPKPQPTPEPEPNPEPSPVPMTAPVTESVNSNMYWQTDGTSPMTDTITIDPAPGVTGVTYIAVPVEKAGAVLSKVNADKLTQAKALIDDVLKSADKPEPAIETPEETTDEGGERHEPNGVDKLLDGLQELRREYEPVTEE